MRLFKLPFEPDDLQWIDINWEMTGVQDLYDDLKLALEPFGLEVWKVDTGLDHYEWYVYEKSEGNGGEIKRTLEEYWDEHEDLLNNEEEYGLSFPWREIATDWKLNGGMIPQFQEAAKVFGVKIYILPDDQAQERLLITKSDLTKDQVLQLELRYYGLIKKAQLWYKGYRRNLWARRNIYRILHPEIKWIGDNDRASIYRNDASCQRT